MNGPVIYIPRDAAALSVGADAVAQALDQEAQRRGMTITVVRTGSRGLLWLEPLIEVAVDGVRHAYGPVTPADVAGLFDAEFTHGGAHPLAQGPVEDIPYLKNQDRVTFARCGVIDPLSLDDYTALGGARGCAGP